jgi:molybdate transport system permease protein
MSKSMRSEHADRARRVPSDRPFIAALIAVSAVYVLLIAGMLLADVHYASVADLVDAIGDANIRASLRLTMISCAIAAILSVIVAVPTGYLLSRYNFRFRNLVDAILDIPIVLPPLVIGLSLLILFNKVELFGRSLEQWSGAAFQWIGWIRPDLDVGITYKVPAVILAQFTVACAFAVRTMRHTFDEISPRHEQVAQTLGCSRGQAFWRVVLPQAGRGIMTAGTLAWARALGEFGPILVFAGATRGKTEVLSTSVFLEISIGNIEGAVAVSLLMVLCAIIVLVVVRSWGHRREIL